MLFIFGKRNAKRNGNGTDGTEQNGTPNGTPENSKDFDVKGYVDNLKERLHPSRANDAG